MMGVLMELIGTFWIVCAVVKFSLTVGVESVFDATIELSGVHCLQQEGHNNDQNDIFHIDYIRMALNHLSCFFVLKISLSSSSRDLVYAAVKISLI
jgi:hypothetical protein